MMPDCENLVLPIEQFVPEGDRLWLFGFIGA